MEATDQGATTTSHVENNIVVESGYQFTSYTNPLAQQPSVDDTSLNGPVEGCVDSPIHSDYGLDAPFWGTSMGHAIALFGVNRPPPEYSSPSEEEYRQIQSAIHHAQEFQERMQILDTILATPIPHKEPMSALLPHNTDPWPNRYHSLVDSMKPIDPVETSKHPGQTSDPTVANVRSVSSPPRSSRDGGESSNPVVSVTYSARGQPLT